MDDSKFPFVSVIMPIRNEGDFIERSVGAALAQDYPPEKMEVLICDGRSTDDTRAKVAALQAQDARVKLVDNPGHIVPTGFNAGLRVAQGEMIVRVDGHTEIAPDYVRQCVLALRRTGADNVGGKMTAVGLTPFGQTVAQATSTPFGVGGARFHYSNQEEWVDTVYLGAWPRAVFARLRGFDEEMVRNQDDEFNYRLREAGGRILLCPAIRSRYTARSSPRTLWRQYFQYGFWKVRVLQKHPVQMRPRQFIPPLFVLSLFLAALLSLLPSGWILLMLVSGSYVVANLFASVSLAYKNGWRHLFLLPFIFNILHMSYGLGFLIGLAKFWNRWSDKVGKTPAWQSTDA